MPECLKGSHCHLPLHPLLYANKPIKERVVSSSLCGKTHFLNELVTLLGYFYTVTVKPWLLQQVLNCKYYLLLCFYVFLSQTTEFCEMIWKYFKKHHHFTEFSVWQVSVASVGTSTLFIQTDWLPVSKWTHRTISVIGVLPSVFISEVKRKNKFTCKKHQSVFSRLHLARTVFPHR